MRLSQIMQLDPKRHRKCPYNRVRLDTEKEEAMRPQSQ